MKLVQTYTYPPPRPIIYYSILYVDGGGYKMKLLHVLNEKTRGIFPEGGPRGKLRGFSYCLYG